MRNETERVVVCTSRLASAATGLRRTHLDRRDVWGGELAENLQPTPPNEPTNSPQRPMRSLSMTNRFAGKRALLFAFAAAHRWMRCGLMLMHESLESERARFRAHLIASSGGHNWSRVPSKRPHLGFVRESPVNSQA